MIAQEDVTGWHRSDSRVNTRQKDSWDFPFPGVSYFFVLWGVQKEGALSRFYVAF